METEEGGSVLEEWDSEEEVDLVREKEEEMVENLGLKEDSSASERKDSAAVVAVVAVTGEGDSVLEHRDSEEEVDLVQEGSWVVDLVMEHLVELVELVVLAGREVGKEVSEASEVCEEAREALKEENSDLEN